MITPQNQYNNAVHGLKEQKCALDSEVDLVIDSYKQSIEEMRHATQELNDVFFTALLTHVDNIESVVVKNSLSSSKGKVKSLETLSGNILAMEQVFSGMKTQYSEILNSSNPTEEGGTNGETGTSLQFGKDEDTI